MANPTIAFGLRPVRYRSGAAWTGACNPYYVPSGESAAFFIGDPVTINGDSNDAQVSAVGAGTFESGMLAEVVITTLAATNVITGVVVGVFPVTESSLPYKPATTEAVVMVADDPNLVFQIRDDGTTLLTVDSIGLNAIMESGTGDTTTGRSGYVMDTNSDAPAVDSTNQLRILNMSRIPDNELLKDAVWDVSLQNHTEAAGSAVAGVA